MRNIKGVAFMTLECFHHTTFHFIDTIKVRYQARNNNQDVCHFFKNKVMT